MAEVNGVYPGLSWPPAPTGRPYVVLNMVSTLDGKTVSGSRNEPVGDLGSDLDRATMRQIEASVDGVMVGHTTLQATPGLWYPPGPKRYVVSGSGQVNPSVRFFTDDPGSAYVVTLSTSVETATPGLQFVCSSGHQIDWGRVLGQLLAEHGVAALLVEGGSELNASLLSADVVDELFLTLAPKIKLGRETPTLTGGDALARETMRRFSLVSCVPVGSEVFLRYRREWSG